MKSFLLIAALLLPLAAAAQSGKPSTADDANLCVSEPVVGDGRKYCGKGYTARVTNTCGQKVDVRLCMRSTKGGWDCRAELGVAPGKSWGNSWCLGTGETFVDARAAGSSRPLRKPPGT